MPWPGRAPRRVRCERAAPGRRGLPGDAPVPGLQAGAAGTDAAGLHRLPRAGRGGHRHRRGSRCLGGPAGRRRPGLAQAPAGRRARFRGLPEDPRSRLPGAAQAAARGRRRADHAVLVLPGGDRGAGPCRRHARPPAAGRHLPGADQPAGRHRLLLQGSAPEAAIRSSCLPSSAACSDYVTGCNTCGASLSAACRGADVVELCHELAVGGAGCVEVLVAFVELELQVGCLLFEAGDFLVEGVDVGGCAEP